MLRPFNPKNDDYCLNDIASQPRFQPRPRSWHAISGSPDCSSSTLLRLTTPKVTTTWTTSLSVSGDTAWSSSTLLRPTIPKMTTTAWMTSPLFREFGFLSIKCDQVRAFKRATGSPDCSLSTHLRTTTPSTTSLPTTFGQEMLLLLIPAISTYRINSYPIWVSRPPCYWGKLFLYFMGGKNLKKKKTKYKKKEIKTIKLKEKLNKKKR